MPFRQLAHPERLRKPGRAAAALLAASLALTVSSCAFRPELALSENDFYTVPVPEFPDLDRRQARMPLADQLVPPPAGPGSENESGANLKLHQRGIASWYGGRHHGTLTASGERFDKSALTAAHRTLPFGSLVRVRNLETQQEVIVRITDRGPFIKNRIIDLSESAARKIGMYAPGLARVELEVLEQAGS